MMKTMIHLIRHALPVVAFISRRMEKIRTDTRDICLNCHKSFSDRTNALFYCSHFILDQWIHFIELELYKMTPEDEAQVLETSKTTCFYMRHKLSCSI